MQITLAPLDGQLESFTPGAHLPITAFDGAPDRRYSLVSDPADKSAYRIAVLRAQNGISSWLHENLRPGMTIAAEPPKNFFPLADGANKTILIAGGIGITPIFSFVRKLTETRSDFELHYASRSLDRMAFRAELMELCSGAAHFYYDDNQRMDLDLIVPHFKTGLQIYVCGPRAMIEAVKSIAAARHWPASAIHFESFGGAAAAATAGAIDLWLTRSQLQLKVSPGQSILDVIRERGIPVTFGCNVGACGKCATAYTGAAVEHRDSCLGPEQREAQLCICVSKPRGPSLTLDL